MKSIYTEKNGYVTTERCEHNGMIAVALRDNDGELIDKIRCDTRENAYAYIKSFRKIAKNGVKT